MLHSIWKQSQKNFCPHASTLLKLLQMNFGGFLGGARLSGRYTGAAAGKPRDPPCLPNVMNDGHLLKTAYNYTYIKY